MTSPTITTVLVTYAGPVTEVREALGSLRAQTRPVAQVICVDQSPDGRFVNTLGHDAGAIEFVRPGRNIGYSSACNLAAERATGDYLLFLNPDAIADKNCLAVLGQVLDERPDAAVAGAQVLLPGRAEVNAGDNALHLSGISWAGHFGQAPEQGPPRPTAVASGAALLVRRAAFEELRGYTDGFFMYYDDVDLAWRARLAGWEVLFCPDAVVEHDYEFLKGGYKWKWLERNRWWCLLAHLRPITLSLLTPLLLVVEVAILLRARREGWLSDKLDGYRALWRDRRALITRRGEIQRTRRVGDRAIIERMTAEIDSPFLHSPLSAPAAPWLRGYRKLVWRLTG